MNSMNVPSEAFLTRLNILDNQITKLQDWYERLLSLSKDRSICLKELGKLKKNYIWKVCCYCISSMLVLCIFREIPVLKYKFWLQCLVLWESSMNVLLPRMTCIITSLSVDLYGCMYD